MKDYLKLYLVTDRELSLGRSLDEVVAEAVRGGVTVVQLREKNASTGEFISLARRLLKLLKPLNIPLIINDRVDVALAVDADGVHIGQSDMYYEDARRLLGPDKIIGLSVESFEDIEAANALDVDYIGISPVYGTPTKTDTAEPFGLEGLRKAVEMSVHPTVAIGGMNAATIGEVMAVGTDGVAVVSAICSAENIPKATSELRMIVDSNARMSWSKEVWKKSAGGMVMKSSGEFGFIDYIKANFPVPEGTIGIGDDCAVMPAGDVELLFSTDLLMEGVHFLRNESSPEDVGWKAAAVNLSDIAAMGGTPVATFLSIALPKDAQGEWAERFIEGYTQISRKYDVPLLGGDTTSSLRDIAVNVGVMGRCPSGKKRMRSDAKVGETIYVTGPLGDSAGGLKAILKGIDRTDDVNVLIERHKRPVPRIEAGKILMESCRIGAMMDISDGIASDLRHIMMASGVGVVIALDKLPSSPQLLSVCAEQGWDRYELATSGGEDFELLFTGPEGLENELDMKVYPIGKIIRDNDLIWTVDDRKVDFDYMGYEHF